MVRAFALLSIPAALALAAPACGSNTCGGERADSSAAPEINSFFVLTPDKQIPGDPWTVVFGIEFADTTPPPAEPITAPLPGDLGLGKVEFYLNSSTEPLVFQLDKLFRQNGLPPATAEGAFWVHLRFREGTVDDGARVRIGAQLIDATDLRSNCYTLDLEFDVYPAASLERAAPTWSVASTRCRREGRS